MTEQKNGNKQTGKYRWTNRKSILLSMLFSCIITIAYAQPFAKELAAFQKQDSIAFPAKNQILLIGSSSFTLWKNVQQYFPKYPMLNRAFGGSTLADLWYYRQQIIDPYQPRQIIVYCGENDFASSDTITVNTVVNRFIQLFTYIRTVYPQIPVAYVSMKPSPSRRHLLAKYQAANTAIQQWLARQKRTAFIDVYSHMVQSNGEPLPHIFLQDSLHMNAQGYSIWQRYIKPVLRKK